MFSTTARRAVYCDPESGGSDGMFTAESGITHHHSTRFQAVARVDSRHDA